MIVGFLRTKETPPLLAKLLSYTCKYYDIELVYFKPSDISMKNGTVRGQMLIDNKWEEVITGIPKFIDVNPYLYSNKEHIKKLDYLKKHTKLSINRRNIVSKDKLQEILATQNDLREFGIPSANANNFEGLIDFVNQHKKIVLKPVYGYQGKSVIVVTRLNDDTYVLGMGAHEEKLTKPDLEKYFENEIQGIKYVMQKFIVSRSKQGDPFDCRIHMEKDGEGKWQIANMMIRIGIGQTVISNINQGGGVSPTLPFLETNFDDKADEIYQRLKKLANTVPGRLEELTNSELMVMGLDIGIDPEGNTNIFEANSFPITSYNRSYITLYRAQYYKYQIEQNNIGAESDNKTDIRINTLEKKIKQMKSSRSWKLTMPIRKIKKIIKGAR